MSRRTESEELNHPYSDGDAERGGGLSYWLIHHAARSAPELLSQRLEEEWLADLAVRPSAASRLRFALGCCWATRVIALEHSLSTARLVTPGIEAKATIASYAHHNLGWFSRRTTALGLVACLHIAVFYAFMVGLSNTITKVNTPPLQNRDLQETHPRDMPPLPPPNLDRVKLDLPDLDPNVTIIVDEDPNVIRAAGPQVLPPTHGSEQISPPHVAKQMQGGPGAGFPNPDDYYPPLAKRLEEQGVATVRVCVDANGRLTSDPTTFEGTGSARLDEGALKLARAGSGHYRATTEDGRPVNSCYPFRIRFQIKN
jgi:TonB family protein